MFASNILQQFHLFLFILVAIRSSFVPKCAECILIMDFIFCPHYAFLHPLGVTNIRAESQKWAEIVSDKAGIQGLLFYT